MENATQCTRKHSVGRLFLHNAQRRYLDTEQWNFTETLVSKRNRVHYKPISSFFQLFSDFLYANAFTSLPEIFFDPSRRVFRFIVRDGSARIGKNLSRYGRVWFRSLVDIPVPFEPWHFIAEPAINKRPVKRNQSSRFEFYVERERITGYVLLRNGVVEIII